MFRLTERATEFLLKVGERVLVGVVGDLIAFEGEGLKGSFPIIAELLLSMPCFWVRPPVVTELVVVELPGVVIPGLLLLLMLSLAEGETMWLQ